MQPARSLLGATALLFCLPVRGDAATSDWLSAPKPEFPSSALKAGSEGSVKLRAVLAKDGHVTSTIISRSSGNSILDRTAQQAVSKWRMKPSAITTSDARQGRETIVEFKQEALVAAIYPDRQAYFRIRIIFSRSLLLGSLLLFRRTHSASGSNITRERCL